MKKMSLLVSALAFVMTGCGASIKHQEVTKAPKSSSELGWIATDVTESQHIEIMQNHPAGQFRNHGNGFAYEYRGLSKEEILEHAPSAKVEKNIFIPLRSTSQTKIKTVSERVESYLNASLDSEFNLQTCPLNTFLPMPNIDMQNLTGATSRSSIEFGHSVAFSKKDVKEGDDGLTGWLVLPPNGSEFESAILPNESIAFSPDMGGSFAIVLLYKKNGLCNFKRRNFFVYNNAPYEPDFTDQDQEQLASLAQTDFYQVSASKSDAAQALLAAVSHEVVKVAVLDSGVNYNNPLLKRRMWTNPKEVQGDGIDNDLNGLVDDYVGYDFADDDGQPMDNFGHGSHVAGLVAGELTGSSSDNVQIIAIKVGSGANGPDIGSVASGILYAIEKGAKIINLSFGSSRATETIKAALKVADEAGVLVVAASGNGDQFGVGRNNDVTPFYSSSYDLTNILSVASVRPDGVLTRYSNFGVESVDVATVGGDPNSAAGAEGLLMSAFVPNPSGIVTTPKFGTSMASPLAAGIAAMVLSAAPDLNPTELIYVLTKTSRQSAALEGKLKHAAVLDAEAAVLSVLSL